MDQAAERCSRYFTTTSNAKSGHAVRVDWLFALYERVGLLDPRTDGAVAPTFDRLIKKIESLLVVKGVV